MAVAAIKGKASTNFHLQESVLVPSLRHPCEDDVGVYQLPVLDASIPDC